MKCLAKRPEDRFASMEELITGLKLRPGAMTTASDSGRHTSPLLLMAPTSSGPQAAPPVQQRRGTLTFVLAVAVVVGVALTAALLTRQDPSPTASAPPSASPLPSAPPTASALPAAPKVTATLHVETEPPGAKVKEEGDIVCETTPCDIAYTGEQADPTYEHLLTFLKSDYRLERKLVKVGASPLTVKMTRAR